jgi:hypothetical protein
MEVAVDCCHLLDRRNTAKSLVKLKRNMKKKR